MSQGEESNWSTKYVTENSVKKELWESEALFCFMKLHKKPADRSAGLVVEFV